MSLFSWIFGKKEEPEVRASEEEVPKQEMREVYCQTCGSDITYDGGDVSSTGRIYCYGYKPGTDDRCLDTDILVELQRKGVMMITYYDHESPENVQKAIKTGSLKEFGPLESLPNVPKLRTIARSDSRDV